MPTNSFNRFPVRVPRWKERRAIPFPECRSPLAFVARLAAALLAPLLLVVPASAKKERAETFEPTLPPAVQPAATAGAIYAAGAYAPLTSGARASQVGDIVTIILVERTSASKSSATKTDRAGDYGLTPPTTGPLNFIKPSDINFGSTQSFSGKGDSSQSNTLTGEVSVTILEVFPNGTMRVRGEKQLTLNRGDEHVQISGLIRGADISPDNRILSTRVADARIRYTGKGDVARASRQGWLQRFFSQVSPF
jgi:flagellar L-ring protein FlgH